MTGNVAKKSGFGKYIRETKAELRKVSWPSKKETIQHTEVVLVAIVLIAALLGVVDLGFGAILDALIK